MSLLGAHLFMSCANIQQNRVLSPQLRAAVLDIRRKNNEVLDWMAPRDALQLSPTCPPRCACTSDLHQWLFDICNTQTYAIRCRIVAIIEERKELSLSISIKDDNRAAELKAKVCCIEEEKSSVKSLISLIHSVRGLPPMDVMPQEIRPLRTVPATHERMALTLRPHQQDSVSKMLHVEQVGYTLETVTRLPSGLRHNICFCLHSGVFRVCDDASSGSTPVHDGLLSDEMGMGKTLCCIATAVHNPPTPRNTPSAIALEGKHFIPGTLVLVTVSLVGQWEQEIIKSLPSAKLCRYYGPSRHKITSQQLANFDFIVTTTATGMKDVNSRHLLSTCWFHRVIIDEFHTLTQHPNPLKHATFFWCLSGTPSQDILAQLMAPRNKSMQHFMPGRFGWLCFELNPQQIKRPNSQLPSGLADFAVVGTFDRKLHSKNLPIPSICHKVADLPADQMTLPPRTFVTELFDLTPNESVIYRSTMTPLIQNLREMTRDAIIQNHGTIRNWLTTLRATVVDAAQSSEARPNAAFDVKRANDRAEVQELTPNEARALLNGPRTSYAMNDALDAILRGLEGRPPDPGQCTLCLDVMRLPTMLKCTHVFCRECLMDVINTNHGGGGGLCPMCRAATMTQQKYLLQAPPEIAGNEAAGDDDDDGGDEVSSACADGTIGAEEVGVPRAADVERARNAIKTETPSRVRAVLNCIGSINAAAGDAQRRPKFVIFSSMKNILAKIEQHLILCQVKFIAIDGSVPMVKRAEATKSFQDPSSQVNICLLSSRAAAAGLTLTAANHMILVEPATNNDLERQAMGRIHRIGQDRPVTIHRLAARGTVDERTYTLLDSGEITSTGLERFDRVENRAEVCKLMLRILIGDDFAGQKFQASRSSSGSVN